MIKKPSKHRNVKVEFEGIKFDSRKELKRFHELKLLENSGEISELELQKKFEIIPKQILPSGKSERACRYIADFYYSMNGAKICEDIKGYRAGSAYAIFAIKRKLMYLIHKIQVIEL